MKSNHLHKVRTSAMADEYNENDDEKTDNQRRQSSNNQCYVLITETTAGVSNRRHVR
jgi:hypothetical protein